jgi:hypothetical protein
MVMLATVKIKMKQWEIEIGIWVDEADRCDWVVKRAGALKPTVVISEDPALAAALDIACLAIRKGDCSDSTRALSGAKMELLT